MGNGFKEVASLRGDDKKFEDNFKKIKWNLDEDMEEDEIHIVMNGETVVKITNIKTDKEE